MGFFLLDISDAKKVYVPLQATVSFCVSVTFLIFNSADKDVLWRPAE